MTARSSYLLCKNAKVLEPCEKASDVAHRAGQESSRIL
jgi:hypothetical protein